MAYEFKVSSIRWVFNLVKQTKRTANIYFSVLTWCHWCDKLNVEV